MWTHSSSSWGADAEILFLQNILDITNKVDGEATPDTETKIDPEPPTDTKDTKNTANDLLNDGKEVNRPDFLVQYLLKHLHHTG